MQLLSYKNVGQSDYFFMVRDFALYLKQYE